MTSPGPGKDESLWRDLAASVVQQVADRVRSAQSSRGTTPDREPPHHGNHDYAPGGAPDGDHQSGSDRRQSEPSSGPPQPGSIGAELKRLMINGIRATSDSLGEYQAARERRQAERDQRETEREQRRLQAPMRQARGRSKANKVAAVALGTLTAAMVGGSVVAAAEPDVPTAVVGGAVSVAAGAGTLSLARRSRRYAATAQEHARALGLTTAAAAIDLPGGDPSTLVLPPLSSLAHDPVLRLISQRQALAELLPHIDDLAPELAPVARHSETSLAGYAERVVRLERAQSAAGATSLDAPLARAVAQLEEGVQAHQKLVEAAATVLAELESADYGAQPHEQIGEAADRLQALAEGLRQVRNDIPVTGAQPSSMPPITATHAAPARPTPRRARKAHRRRDAAG